MHSIAPFMCPHIDDYHTDSLSESRPTVDAALEFYPRVIPLDRTAIVEAALWLEQIVPS